MTRARARRLDWALATAVVAWLATIELLGGGGAAMHLVPVLLLAVPLLAGRYPGEAALAAAIVRVPAPQAPLRTLTPRVVVAVPPRGGALLGAGLAGRAPPVLSR